jgi:hypothetical protein
LRGQSLRQAPRTISIRTIRKTPAAFQNLFPDQSAEEVPVTVTMKCPGVFFAEGAPVFSLQEIFQIST